MKRILKSAILLLALILLINTAGCYKTQIVRTSLTPIPENVNDILFVAEGRDIRVGIEGSDQYMTVDVDGYYLIHITDLKAMIKEIEQAQE